jgi:uncharacterized protein (UPF0333 family)
MRLFGQRAQKPSAMYAKVKFNVVSAPIHHSSNAYGKVEAILHIFLTLTLSGDDW